ncbi:phosphotransferase [Paenibacillus solisilvae]|uniref:Phosphotransferase n=1 Tax=Paenibacillus solisilvae TaxID=2486751 RepID=A0ABW0VVB2_9BACL
MSFGNSDGDFAFYLEAYSRDTLWRAVKEESGMNNTTRMIYSGKDKYVLRVYDNHRDVGIVQIEHQLLDKLQLAGLPFQVPMPVANLNGSTITISPDGKLAALYAYIEGERPSSSTDRHVEALGAAAGALSNAMSHLEMDREIRPVYKPYYEFEQSHAAMTNEKLERLSQASEVLSKREAELSLLFAERARLAALRTLMADMPHQWIHGDIVFNNSLVHENRISGVLDFEFSTIDLRAMELAVVLAEFPNEDYSRALEQIALFCRGFGSSVKLTKVEIGQLSDLVKLRMLDVFLHFAARYSEGLDGEPVWDHQIQRAAYVCKWLDQYKAEITELFDNYLS